MSTVSPEDMACENTNVLKAHKAHTKDSQIIRKDINTSCNVLLQNKNVLDLKLSPCSVCICFLFGNYPASGIYMSTFRNTLSVPSS